MKMSVYDLAAPFLLLGLLVSGVAGQQEAKQVELSYDDGGVESGFMLSGDGIGQLISDPKKLISAMSFWGKGKHRIAVVYESSFDRNKIVKVRVVLTSFKKGGAPHCEFEVQILDEKWEIVGTRSAVAEYPGVLELEFSNEDVFVGKTFAVALLPQNCKNMYVGVDSSSSGHSYVIYVGKEPKKISEMESGIMKAFNEGVYEFMVRVTVEEVT